MKYSELQEKMREFNKKHGIERKVMTKNNAAGELIRMVGKVVIKNSALSKEFPIEMRTYVFDNYNKALTGCDLGYSIFAHCEYDGDLMRIEAFGDDDIEAAEATETVE